MTGNTFYPTFTTAVIMKKTSILFSVLLAFAFLIAQTAHAQKFPTIDNMKPIIENVIELGVQSSINYNGGTMTVGLASDVTTNEGNNGNGTSGSSSSGNSSTNDNTQDNQDTSSDTGPTSIDVFTIPIDNIQKPEDYVPNFNELISVYPNPADQVVNIELPYSELTEIRLYNIIGQQVLAETHTQIQQLSIEVNNFVPGIYFLEIYADGRQVSKKVKITR